MMQPGSRWTPLVPPSEGPQVRTRAAPPLRFALRVFNAAFVIVGLSTVAMAFHNRSGCPSGGDGGGGGSPPSPPGPAGPAWTSLPASDAAAGRFDGGLQWTFPWAERIDGVESAWPRSEGTGNGPVGPLWDDGRGRDAPASVSPLAAVTGPSLEGTWTSLRLEGSTASLRRTLRGNGDGAVGGTGAGGAASGRPSVGSSAAARLGAVPRPHRWWFLWCAFGAGTYLAALGGIGFGSLRLSQLRSLSTYVALCTAAAGAAGAAAVWDETGRRPPLPPDATGCLAELESWASAHPVVARRLAVGALASLLLALACSAALRAAHGSALRSWIEATSDATARTRDLLVGTARSALDGQPGSVWSGAVRDRYAIDSDSCERVDASARALWPLLQQDGSHDIFSTEAY